MKKKAIRLVTLLFIVFVGIFSIMNMHTKKEAAPGNLRKGVTLDIARKYYSKEVIKGFVDVLADNGGTFLQLHMSDDQNVGIEMALIHQTPENAYQEDGRWISNTTGMPFLSKAELSEIVAYAQTRDIAIIPEIDTPAHMQKILEVLKTDRPEIYKEIALPENDERNFNTIDFSKQASIDFAKLIIEEYIPIFKNQSRRFFHIGLDEVVLLPIQSNPSLVNYANQLNAFIKEQGFTTRMWNDGVTIADVNQYDKDIQITYWSHTGELNVHNKTEKDWLGNRFIASPEDFLKNDFKILNYNGYYLYFLPSDKYFERSNYDYTINDMKENWNLDALYLNSLKHTEHVKNIIGSSLTIWGEAAYDYTDEEILAQTTEFIIAYLQMPHSEAH